MYIMTIYYKKITSNFFNCMGNKIKRGADMSVTPKMFTHM